MRIRLILILVLCLALLTSCEKNQIGESSSGSVESDPATQEVENQTEETSSEEESTGENKVDKTLWNLILVDNKNLLPEDFTITTTKIPSRYIINENANKVDERILESLLAMLDDAEAVGLKIRVTSAYRDVAYQENLFNNQVQKNMKSGLTEEEARKYAAEYVAIPGTSEHHTGLAVDLVSQDWFSENDDLYATFEDTEEGKWLFGNAYKYGFILSFPKYQAEMGIIDINYEPWHYRYVGVEHSAIIKEKEYVLMEYLYYY